MLARASMFILLLIILIHFNDMLAHASMSLKSFWYICWFAYQVFSIFLFIFKFFTPSCE